MNFDLNSLLDGSSSNPASLLDPAKLLAPLMPFIIGFTILSIVLTVLYIISLIDRWRANRAMIEMRNILREMNERDEARSGHPSADVHS